MKIKSYKLLFRLFSYFSDKTNGAQFFVKYKLMLGTLVLGLTGTSANIKAQNKETPKTENDTIIPLDIPPILCYVQIAPPEEGQDNIVKIKGFTKEQDGSPLHGTNIVIKNKPNGVISEKDGSFTLEAKKNDILIFSFIGYKRQEIPASKLIGKPNEIVMEEDNTIMCYEPVIMKYKPKKLTKLPYHQVHVLPVSPVGDREQFTEWLENNIRYNGQMIANKTEGQLLLNFTIDKKGNIKDAKVISKLSPDADAEALRLLFLPGKWQPATYNDKPIETVITIPVRFTLPQND